MRDIERRLTERRDGRLRMIGIACGMVIVFALWPFDAYWTIRNQTLALPGLLDQWLFMGLIGFAVSKLLGRLFGARRFPYLQSDLTVR